MLTLRGVDPSLANLPASDALWVDGRARETHRAAMASIPMAWAEKLSAGWLKLMHPGRAPRAIPDHLARCNAIRAAHRAGVAPDANDGQICQLAHELARDTARRLEAFKAAALRELSPPARNAPADPDRMVMLGMVLEALHWVEARGLTVSLRRAYLPGFLARVRCERWWRRLLRGLHARAVETTARAIGLVHKQAGCYVSNESLRRRQGQVERNERALESVMAVNEHGQEYTLAELAEKGPANREIRRMELMTRIAGFELIARECGHAAYFVTVTCPSRMHAYRTKPGRKHEVEPNPRHDGTTVEQAHEHLTTQWRRFNSAAQRAGLELYGFRIAEPNHDGTPHWHALIFLPRTMNGLFKTSGRRAGLRHFDAECFLGRTLRRYFLCGQDSNERGASAHRITMERIDWTRGSAAGYVAKYVSKNIDGYKVEKDLYGNDTLTSSKRVDAWASTHRIRQFQQLGGAPVGVWRELRRMHPDQAQAAEVVAYALDAVNIKGTEQADSIEAAAPRSEELPGVETAERVTAAHGWSAYLHVQGGHRVPRRALRLGVLREQTGELGRYGEPMPPKPVGVRAIEVRELPAFGIVRSMRKRFTVDVESERASWLVVPKGNAALAAQRLKAAGSSGFPPGGEAARPWSPVNNCTPTNPPGYFGPAVERHKKRGRWHRWTKKEGPGGSTTERKPHAASVDGREGQERGAGPSRPGGHRAGA